MRDPLELFPDEDTLRAHGYIKLPHIFIEHILFRKIKRLADQAGIPVDVAANDLLDFALGLHAPVTGVISTLTTREREVALLITRGHSNRQIARELHISPETVKTHVSRIHKKAGTHSKVEFRYAFANRAAELEQAPSPIYQERPNGHRHE